MNINLFSNKIARFFLTAVAAVVFLGSANIAEASGYNNSPRLFSYNDMLVNMDHIAGLECSNGIRIRYKGNGTQYRLVDDSENFCHDFVRRYMNCSFVHLYATKTKVKYAACNIFTEEYLLERKINGADDSNIFGNLDGFLE